MENGSKWWFLIAVIIYLSFPSSYGNKRMDIHSMHIQSKVTSRFARTLITTMMRNFLNSSQEAIFDVELPKTAFITNFSMTVDNVTTVGTVTRKEEAKRQYDKAVSKGQSAGLVQSTGRKMEHFKVSVNVGALATATFKLTYEELLKRHLGNYELLLKVRPKELVENFQINVDIAEPQGISFLKAVGTFISNELSDMVKVNLTENKAHIEFIPTVDQQRNCPNCLETHLDGDLVIKYDVKRDNSAGKVQVVNGYFVHYFAPASLQRMPKNVVFVIDRSGSMHGDKIKQAQEAFIKILDDVPREDRFGILLFDDKVNVWRKKLLKATPANISKAKEFVLSIDARGGTDINKALLDAAKMLTDAAVTNEQSEVRASILLFLSDGDPTSGITNHKQIIENLKQSLGGKATLYCLGFGSDVDYNFLEKLSLENGGLARRIYEDSDSALQLQGFYNEVAHPMLLNINLEYLDNSVDHVTQSSFRHYYQGSEIIVAGHVISASLQNLTAQVTAQGAAEPYSVTVDTPIEEEDDAASEQSYIFGDFTERLWAYLTIEQLLTKLISTEGDEKHRVTEKALNLSLKYNFVTPLTSMVVTPPEEEKENKQLVANKPREGSQTDYDFRDAQMVDRVVHHYGHQYDYGEEMEDHEIDMSLVPDMFMRGPKVGGGRVNSDDEVEGTASSTISATHSPPPCETFQALIRDFRARDRICFKILQAQNMTVNLLHEASTGVTINSYLEPHADSVTRLGLLHNKMRLTVDVTAHNITATHDGGVTTYGWDSSFEKTGFVKKDGGQLLVTVKDGVTVTIHRSGASFYLSATIENNYLSSNDTTGMIGQLLRSDKISFQSKHLAAGDQILPLRSLTNCDFAQYGDNRGGDCLLVALSTNELLTGASAMVPDIFHVPE
ncbi:inter-alpha-trypsin inhibitor heavy chain H3-like isoform X2 [Pseudophryne corroboree]|uniref:inter-alpha-trypsin inhibitor heavy chain H3-like isoform X2 n=1 Tax=Pseudophryne corroboree TaxID=495146 RepID=UPI0030817F4D